MAGAGCRRLEALSFRIVTLLFLVQVGLSLDFKDSLNKLINDILRTRESARLLREIESGTEHILTLLDTANSAANSKHLKLFQEYLQEAVDEANQQKLEKVADANTHTQLEIDQYLSKIQTGKHEDPLMRKMAETMKKVFRIIGQNLLLHKDLYSGKANETETNLEKTLKDLNSQLQIHDPAEL